VLLMCSLQHREGVSRAARVIRRPFEQDQGDYAKALRYARELVAINPGDARLRSLVSDLEKKAAHGFSLGIDLD
jgi:hypothetical protein